MSTCRFSFLRKRRYIINIDTDSSYEYDHISARLLLHLSLHERQTYQFHPLGIVTYLNWAILTETRSVSSLNSIKIIGSLSWVDGRPRFRQRSRSHDV